MKKSKLLLFPSLILSLAVFLAACGEKGVDDSSSGAGDIGGKTEIIKLENTEADDGQGEETHEMQSYFDLRADDGKVFDSIVKIDGKLESFDEEHNLAVVVDEDLDTMNNVIKTVKVYDLLSGEVIREDSVSSPYGSTPLDGTVNLNVTLHYPVIKVSKLKYTAELEGDDPKPEYEISYYLACKDGEVVHTTDKNSNSVITDIYANGLVRVDLGDKQVWIDKDLDIIRSVDSILINNGGDAFASRHNFKSEYDGYLYSWNEDTLFAFDHSGVVSGRYDAADDSVMNCFVLNNGKVLIQEFTDVGAYGSYDIILSGTHYTMKSMIMDHTTGEISDIELEYIVDSLESRYEQEAGLFTDEHSIKLKDCSDNLAVIYKVANRTVSSYAGLCVLDNDCKVVYEVKNDTEGVDFKNGALCISGNKYSTLMQKDGYYWVALFDLDGNFISSCNVDSNVTDKYIVTDKAIYNHKMELVYDYSAAGYKLYNCATNKILLSKDNFEAGGREIYEFDTDDGAVLRLLADGINTKFGRLCDGVYMQHDVEKELYKIYNADNTELLVSAEAVNVFECEDVVLLVTTFNGEQVAYIVK